MTIKGLQEAIALAEDRVRRSREPICIIQVGADEYILWREVNLHTVTLVYKYYKVVKTIRMK